MDREIRKGLLACYTDSKVAGTGFSETPEKKKTQKLVEHCRHCAIDAWPGTGSMHAGVFFSLCSSDIVT